MNRRTFFGRMGMAVAGAALAVHMELGSLAPVLQYVQPPEKWWYLIEETLPLYEFSGMHRLTHVRWIDQEEMKALGLKHEDFSDNLPVDYGGKLLDIN